MPPLSLSDNASSRGGALLPLNEHFRRIGARLGWLAAAIGGLALIGWIANQPLLKSWLPNQVEAKANTAVCLMLAGLALGWKATAVNGAGWQIRVANLAAALVAFVGIATVAEYSFGWELGNDQVIFGEKAGAAFTVNRGRMALPTAGNFLLVGWAILLLRPDRDARAVRWLSVPVAVVASLAFVGQLYNLPVLTALGPFTPMALPSGMAFLLLSAGILLAGWRGLGAWLRRSGQVAGLVGGLVLLVLLSGAVARSATAWIGNTHYVTHTYEVLDRLGQTLSALQDVETASRGYVLTGDPEFLEPYGAAPARLTRLQRELRELTADNAIQTRRLYTLQTHVDRKLAAAADQIALRKSGDVTGARDLVAAGHGRQAMDAVRQDLQELRAEEERLLQERGERLRSSTSRTLITLVIGLTASFALLFTSFSLLRREIARRTRMAAELQRSEESLAITLNSIGDGVLATDTAGRITLLNPIAEALTGWKQAEAKGRPVAEVFRIIHEETRAPAPVPVDTVLATGEIMGLANHTVLIRRDGTECAIADSAAPIRDRDGTILGVVLVFRDVSESRGAQAELDRFFSLSLDFLCIASMVDGYFKRVSPAVTEILGWTVEEFLARPFLDMIHPDDHPAALREIEKQKAGQRVMQFECRFEHKNGGWRVLSWRSAPQPDGLMYATARDVTERKRTEEALRKYAEEIYDLYNRAPCGYHSLDADGRIVAMNETELGWLGYTREEVVDRMTIADLVAPESQAALREQFARLKVAGEISGLELQLVRKDGKSFPVLLNATALRDEAGNFLSSRSTAFDITTRKRAEAELDRFFALSLDFLCISSADGYFKRVSPGVTDMLGWTTQEFLTKPYLDLVHPDDQAATLNEVRQQLATGQRVLNFENRYRHHDGSWRLLSWRSVPDPQTGLMYATARDITESRRAQLELDRFFTLSVDFLCIAGLDGYFKRASPSVIEILGWTPEEFTSMPYIDLIHPDDREATAHEVEKLGAGQKVLNFENRYRHKDGSWRLLSWRATPHLEAGLLYCSGRDVTELRKMEQLLRQTNEDLESRVRERTAEVAQSYEAHRLNERRFRALIEHGADGISVIDADNNILYLSPAVAAVEGYTAEELSGRNGRELTHPDDLPLVERTVQQLLANPGRPIPVLWRRRHKAGHWIWLEGIATNLLHDPAVKGIVTNYRDVTGRVRAQLAQEQLAAIVSSSDDAIISKTLEGVITSWNPGAERLFGFSAAEIVGSPIARIFPPELLDEEEVIIERMKNGQRVEHFETIRVTKEGRRLDVSITISPIKDAEGRVIGASKIVRDITARKRAEDQIRELNTRLEQRVQERTAQLRQANTELESFSYSVSHDLRAPLRHIHGYVEMLTRELEAQLNDRSRRYLRTISEASREMGALIDDLLAFSRMGRSEMAEREVDLARLVEEVRRGLELALRDRDVRWTIGPLPLVQGDAAMLRQVLANLLGNAVKYTRGRTPAQIELGCSGHEEDGRLVFFVRDNGAGFDMKYADKLFGVFQRLHRADEFEGTGIGLASVRRIVGRHGGRTWAESRLGEGATFFFTLKPAMAPALPSATSSPA